MPYAPGIVVRRGRLVFLSGVTAAAVYHSHPHREEEFDLPATMREQAVLAMENLKKTLAAAGCTLADLVSATRFLTDVDEQDDLNRVWAEYLGGHLPTTTTVEVSRLATHARCKIEITAIAVDGGARWRRWPSWVSAPWAAGWRGGCWRPGTRSSAGTARPTRRATSSAAGLTLAKSPRGAAEGVEAVFTMVTDDAALRAVTLGPDGVVAGLGPGAVLVEMSTVSPTVVRELGDRCGPAAPPLLDVPVSGSTITVEQGQASFIVGGDAAALERVRPWLLAMGTAVTHVGPLGLAKTMKVATNLGLAVQMLAFSEAVLLAEKAGIARERAVEALLKSVIASPMVKYRGPFVLGQMPTDAWFKVAMIQKDLQLALDPGGPPACRCR